MARSGGRLDDTWPGQRRGGSSARFYSEFHRDCAVGVCGLTAAGAASKRPYGVPARAGVCGLTAAGRSERKAEYFEPCGPYGVPARSVNPQAPYI